MALSGFPTMPPRSNLCLRSPAQIIAELLNGGAYRAIIDITFAYVDVRDVAEAHMRAAENPEASGRYICSAGISILRSSRRQTISFDGDTWRKGPRTSRPDCEHSRFSLPCRYVSDTLGA